MQVLDLFSGIGGFSLGLERAGMKTVAFCEIDKKAQRVLRKHWPEVPIFSDVQTLTGEVLREHGISVDVICGGFPCQDISVAGKGEGIEGKRSGLWSEFARLIGELRPRYAIVENVSALLNRGLDRVLGDLASLGYDAEWHCIPASAVGAPHRRDRIWIVAHPRHGSGGNVGDSQKRTEHKSQRATDSSSAGGSGQQSSFVAYPSVMQQHGGNAFSEISRPQAPESGNNGCSDIVAHVQRRVSKTELFSPLGHILREKIKGQTATRSGVGNVSIREQWAAEPAVGRVAHGVSGRVDRLKQLGNAVVPQIPEMIGRAIMSC